MCDSAELCNNQILEKHHLEDDNKQRIGFFLNFNLKYNKINGDNEIHYENGCNKLSSDILQKESQFMIIDKKKRISRRNRAVHSVARCPTIPLSSPAGQLLLRTTKTVITPEYLTERLDRIERFCHAPLVSKITARPKYLDKRNSIFTPNCTFKRPLEYSTHMYIFPRRQFSQKRRMENILLINSTLLRRCRPISVRLKKISDANKQNSSSNNKLNIKLTRDNSRSSNWKISSCPSTEIIVDTIDLCTSDEEDNQINFCASKDLYPSEISSIKSDMNLNYNNCSSIKPLVIHTSLPHIRRELNFSAETSLLKSLNNENYSTSCLIQKSINKPIASNVDIGIDLENPMRSSVYIISSSSTTTPPRKSYNGDCETINKCITMEKNVTNVVTENILKPEECIDNFSENNDLISSKTEDHEKRALPLLLHKNRVISIDLTS